MGLQKYKQKRDFSRTPEPSGDKRPSSGTTLRFVIQKHAASRLHYDFRLEIDGVLKSWAVPKGPSLDPEQRPLAVHVEDHPMDYGDFEGVIPQGEYGGGTVVLWDRGTWVPEADPMKQYRSGKLRFQLNGEKLQGGWTLVRMSGRASEGGKNWLLIKQDDKHAKPASEFDPRQELPDSVSSGRSIEQIASQADAVWADGRKQTTQTKSAKSTKGNDKPRPVKQILRAASELTRARKAKQPQMVEPQLPTLVREPPAAEGWLHELKLDGYRVVSILRDGKATLMTRRGKDWTDRFSAIAKALEQVSLPNAIVDGEVVLLRPDGTTDFQGLQNTLRHGRGEDLVYLAFDLPWCGGYDLTKSPLLQRKALLRELWPNNGRIRFADHIDSQGESVFQHACRFALEGVVSKQSDSPYHSGRSRSWVKVKCLDRQEFVIGGFSAPGGSRQHFGSLLLGYHDEQEKLVYCGRVGTGFTSDSMQDIAEELQSRTVRRCPFDEPPERGDRRDVTWVKPELIAEVEFSEWTHDGRLRHPSFQGLRDDKEPHQVTRERPVSAGSTSIASHHNGSAVGGQKNGGSSRANSFAGIQLSNPGRILYPDQGCTKRDLASYYMEAAEWILPYLIDRPLTLVRCPQGRSEKCFYQKHFRDSFNDSVQGIDVEEEGGDVETYVSIKDEAGLISLVQMGVLEIHPWGARADRLDRPDRIVFDLDPHESVSWKSVVEAAQLLRELLQMLGLSSFVRTTGGKGLHVVVPLVRRSPWDEAKQFARDVADAMVRHDSRRYIATASKAKRTNKIFVDYLRNSRGATAIASYSTRARPGATVATPLTWDELASGVQPSEFNIETVAKRLAQQRQAPWQEISKLRQSITKDAKEEINERSWPG